MAEEIDKKAHEVDWEKNPFQVHVNGVAINGMATLKARWNFFTQATQQTFANGLLVREGDITLVNPDKNAPIATLNIQVDEDIHFTRDKQDANNSTLKIVAYPRDTESLDNEGNGAFRELIDREIPHASYKTETRPCYYPSTGFHQPHNDFIEQETGNRHKYGLPLLRAKGRKLTDASALEELRNSDALSTDPNIREAFCMLLNQLMKGNMIGHLASAETRLLPTPRCEDQKPTGGGGLGRGGERTDPAPRKSGWADSV